MPHPGPAVRPAALADRPHVARVLARAFSHDAYTLGLLPPGEVDRRLYQLFSRLFEETVRSGGEAYLAYAGGVPVGGALWQRPDRFVRWATVLTGAPAYMCIFRGRLFDALRTELSVGRHRPSAPHWYLRALGTVPEAQRQGIGSALMRDRLTRVDHH